MSHDELKKAVGPVTGALNDLKNNLNAKGVQVIVIAAPMNMEVDDKPGKFCHALVGTFSREQVFDMCFFLMDNLRKQKIATT